MRLFGKKETKIEAPVQEPETRAETEQQIDEESISNDLLRALITPEQMNAELAIQIPVVDACISLIGYTIASLPIRLYQKKDGKVEEIKDDPRTHLLNMDTGDTMTPFQFWKAVCEDYFLRKGGYAYLKRRAGRIISIHYVEENRVNIIHNNDPIFKDYNILIMGNRYYPHEFLKFLRNTKNGWDSTPLPERDKIILSVAYNTLRLERTLAKKGGSQKGFIETERQLTEPAMENLKNQWRDVYSNNQENVVVLNKGMSFKGTSISPREMQMEELKKVEGGELSMLFHVPPSLFYGDFTEEATKFFVQHAIVPVLTDFEATLDRDMLKEAEKKEYYFAFDTKELTRGGIEERYRAYEIAYKNRFLQVDEIRQEEDREPLGMNMIELGLGTVLFDPKTGEIYTPNTNQVQNVNDLEGKGENNESGTERQ